MSTLTSISGRVRAARSAHAWSQEELARVAGVAPNTVGSIEAGRTVRPSSLAKVMDALNLAAEAEHAWRNGLPADVQMAIEVIGMALRDMPEQDRPAAVHAMLRALRGEA